MSGGRSRGQVLALRQLDKIERSSLGSLTVSLVSEPSKSGIMWVEISLACAGAEHRDGGIRLRGRERLSLGVLENFPFKHPLVWVPHRRFADHPHVQWGRSLCLYQSPATEWVPADGMFGLIERLISWLKLGSVGELDPDGRPLHPPVAYPTADAGCLVVHADAPRAAEGAPWLGVAVMRWVSPARADVIGWRDITQSLPRAITSEAASDDPRTGAVFAALAVVLTRPIGFEFPDKTADLVDALNGEGVDKERLLDLLGRIGIHNKAVSEPWRTGDSGTDDALELPTFVVVGTPSRGIAGGSVRLTHVVAWRLPWVGARIAELVSLKDSDHDELADIGREVVEIGKAWLSDAQLEWAKVYEQRPEVTVRRDSGSPVEWLVGKRVVLLGAGALGGPIAEACVRAGVRSLAIIDNGRVNPGILVRQLYEDADVHRYKAEALRDRLKRVRPTCDIESLTVDVVDSGLELADIVGVSDLVIDATANRAVSAVLELAHVQHGRALMSVIIGHDAQRGIVTLAKPQATGAGYDVLRRVGIAVHADPALRDVAEDFFPESPRTTFFQPEPGCSEATFVGSYPETTALAGQMLLTGLRLIADEGAAPMSAAIVRLSGGAMVSTGATLSWPNDMALTDDASGMEIRVSAEALAEMRAEARRGRRARRPNVETGGTLLGQIDDAVGVVWVSAATGPPPDSRLSSTLFVHGVSGVEQISQHWDRHTAGAIRFIGMWHSHPFGIASPSPTDEQGMAQLVLPVAKAPDRALMIIVGGVASVWQEWLDDGTRPAVYAELVERHADTAQAQARHLPPATPREWWHGGYSTDRERQAGRGGLALLQIPEGGSE